VAHKKRSQTLLTWQKSNFRDSIYQSTPKC
jgi:hypothetical protein